MVKGKKKKRIKWLYMLTVVEVVKDYWIWCLSGWPDKYKK